MFSIKGSVTNVERYVFVDENAVFQVDFRDAVWAEGNLKHIYDSAKLALSDVDFIAELKDHIVFVEYKNANIPNAVNPGAFNPASEESLNSVAKKYFDSLHYLKIKGKGKKVRYVYIVEAPIVSSSERLRLRNKLQAKLPFLLQKDMEHELINDLLVLSIEEWNSNNDYARFPLTPCKQELSPE